MIRARKRFAQHFLHDPAVIARIVAAVNLAPGDAAVEIGPGRGALTAGLLRAAGRLDAVEIDRDLAALLRARFAAEPGFVLHEIDALTMDWRALASARGARLRLIGNLPYNISTPLLFRLLECAEAISDMHFMLQKELVDRILAVPGSPAYGRLTVMLAPRVRGERVLDVGAGAFQPAPQVRSSVVSLRVIAPPWPIPPRFAEVVAAAFGQRRKTLRNALRRLLTAGQIEALELDPGARAEQLAPRDFARLAQAAATAQPQVPLARPPGAVLH
ncbi:MAG TPA: 16S rRNA (adenine(1518)-N(6)/adenine(1519)-N(6))-dimethyltransferase RsmA [Steroidobacteraceae bacterium]|nr:16S rRNA (adenine(1518)-N(6)/adenine(1519)-N(6))-dimethyltransferase RsmA [Steroidobacteraceae bacterium]